MHGHIWVIFWWSWVKWHCCFDATECHLTLQPGYRLHQFKWCTSWWPTTQHHTAPVFFCIAVFLLFSMYTLSKCRWQHDWELGPGSPYCVSLSKSRCRHRAWDFRRHRPNGTRFFWQLFMVALWNKAEHYIFVLWFLSFSSFFLLSFPHLISAVTDWMSAILPHMVWP